MKRVAVIVVVVKMIKIKVRSKEVLMKLAEIPISVDQLKEVTTYLHTLQ